MLWVYICVLLSLTLKKSEVANQLRTFNLTRQNDDKREHDIANWVQGLQVAEYTKMAYGRLQLSININPSPKTCNNI
jgi:hypothetical protein